MVVYRTLSKWYDNTCKEEILESDFGGSVGGLERRDEKQETQQREEKSMKQYKFRITGRYIDHGINELAETISAENRDEAIKKFIAKNGNRYKHFEVERYGSED